MATVKIVVEPFQTHVSGAVPHDMLHDLLGIQVPGAEYSDACKNREAYLRLRSVKSRTEAQEAEFLRLSKAKMWDGIKRIYRKHGQTATFPTGLLPRVMAALEPLRLDYVWDRRIPDDRPHLKFPTNNVDPRYYQVDAAEAALEEGRGIIEIGTGGGKTEIAIYLVSRACVSTLFLVHTKELLEQARERFANALYDGALDRVGQIGDGQVHLRPVTIATMQAVCAGLGAAFEKGDEETGHDDFDPDKIVTTGFMQFWGIDPHTAFTDYQGPDGGPWMCATPRAAIAAAVEHTQMVILDECQHAACATLQAIVGRAKSAAYILGLSATPYREDGMEMLMEGVIADIIYRKTASQLIREGFLMRPHILMENSKAEKKSEKLYATAYRREIVDHEQRNIAVVAAAQEDLRTLVLVRQIDHGKELAGRIGCPFVSGKEARAKRRLFIRDLKSGALRCLVATTLADEGLDAPPLEQVIAAGGGKSRGRAKQRVGRVTRKSAGKVVCRFRDFYDHGQRHMDEHSALRLQAYREEEEYIVEVASL